MPQLPDNEYAGYFQRYISLVKGDDLKQAFLDHHKETFDFWNRVDESVGDYRYAPEKWTVKEVLQHVIDTERIMAFRALTIARVPGTVLSGFDQDVYAAAADVSQRTLADMLEEFHALRQSNMMLFTSFSDKELRSGGVASDNKVSVRALGYVIIGHAMHHNKVIFEKYLN